MYPVPFGSSDIVYRTPSGYTNHLTNNTEYRYYKLCITGIRGRVGDILQFSEFDILDNSRHEVDGLKIYAGTDSSIPHEDWQNLTDNSTGTKYCSTFNGRAYFLFDAKSPIGISAYRIYSANDSYENIGRNPTSWTLSGTNTYTTNPDNSSWELIDSRMGDTSIGQKNYTGDDFDVEGKAGTVESITLGLKECNMEVGDSMHLSAEIQPKSLLSVGLLWKSTNTSVAKVDQNGNVVAVGKGNAQIIVMAPYFGTASAMCEVVVTEPDYVLGDVNGDGNIDGVDLVAMVNIMHGTESSMHIRRAADMNGDGAVDSSDIILLVRYILDTY